VTVDVSELETALVNLVINARDAMPTGGTVTVTARNCAGSQPKGHDKAGDFVAISVSDAGIGIAPDVLAKIFDPFFTTKPVGKGTGLGLSVSYGIIDSYGGTIGYHGNDRGGATFYFELPASDPAASNRLHTPDGAAQSNDRTSLLHERVSSSV
jgi:signal transduction histidine kinase